MGFTCPLCGQPVSPSVYQKITGIWTERQRLLKKVKAEKAKLAKRLAQEKAKLQKEKNKFKKQKTALIKQAVNKQTKRFEKRIVALQKKEMQIKKKARERIQKITAQEHVKAEKLATMRLNTWKKGLRASVREQIKIEKKRATMKERQRLQRMQNSVDSALQRMQIKSRQLRGARLEIKELRKQLQKQTTPQLEGLLYERELVKALRKKFREDKIWHTGKRGDVVQNVMRRGEQVGVIVYECKRVKHYQSKHVKQAADAKKKRNADFTVLVTNAMKRGTRGFFVKHGVIVVHAAGVLHIAAILRNQISQIAGMKLGQQQRDKAIKLILDYLEGPEFANSVDAIIHESISVYESLMDEIKKHIATWKKRYLSYKNIYEEATTVKTTSKSLLSGEPKQKIQTEPMPALAKLPETEEPKVPIKVAVPVRKKKPVGIAVVEAGDDNVREL